MSAHGLREILNLSGEIDAVAFATIAFGSEERFLALLNRSGAPPCEPKQFVRAAVPVLKEALVVNSDETQVLQWFRSARLPLFANKTPAEVAASGPVNSLVEYIKSLEAGWTG